MKIGDYVSFINYENEYGAHFTSVPAGEVVTAEVVEVHSSRFPALNAVDVKHIKHGYTQTVRVLDLIQKEAAA